MPTPLLTLFTTYLIYPLLALLLVLVAALLARKNGLLQNKRLVVYTLLSVLVFSVPGLLGFLDYHFMPYAYIALAAMYLLVGLYNDRLLEWVFQSELRYRVKITYTVFQLVVSMALFALVFNLCNELKYGPWASTVLVPLVLVSLLRRSYEVFIRIPALVYKVWDYAACPGCSNPEDIDHRKLKVVLVELFKQESDPNPIRINAKAPDELLLGDWIKLIFEDYNKKSPHAPIDVYNQADSGWIFYVKSWALAPRRYLDYDLTVGRNRIREKHLIVAKRVKHLIID